MTQDAGSSVVSSGNHHTLVPASSSHPIFSVALWEGATSRLKSRSDARAVCAGIEDPERNGGNVIGFTNDDVTGEFI